MLKSQQIFEPSPKHHETNLIRHIRYWTYIIYERTEMNKEVVKWKNIP